MKRPARGAKFVSIRSIKVAGIALVLACTIASCGDNDPDTTAEVAATGAKVPFHPAASGATRFGDIPWPSDLYLDASGHVGEVPGLERLVNQSMVLARGLAALDGFGRASGALFYLDAAIDPQSLPRTWDAATQPTVSVFFADVDDSSALRGTRYPAYAKYLPALGCISVIPVPGVVLPPGVRHAAVVTGRVRSTDGARLIADDELQRITQLAAAARVTDAERLYGEALDRLASSRLVARKSDVAGLAVFTTSRQVFELAQLRDRLREQTDPQLLLDSVAAAPYAVAVFGIATQPSLDDWLGTPDRDENGREWPGSDNPGGIAHDQIAVVASGAFVAPSFLARTRHFERDAQGELVIANATAKVPVTFVIPRTPPPATGYPVVIHGHGLSNHRGSMLGVANELARAGFVVVGIDDVLHGARGGNGDLGNTFPGTYRGPDGIPDAIEFPLAFFAGFRDFVAVRDNFRQSVLDQCSLVRLLQSATLDLTPLAAAAGGATPVLDSTRIYWSGGSLGGIMGTMTIAVEPEISAAALQVPGAGFMQIISTNSEEVAPLVSGVSELTLGVLGHEVADEFHPVAELLGAITEAGDPIAYAPHVLGSPLIAGHRSPDVLVTYAVDDEVMPNIATMALIRALGLELATPHVMDVPGIRTSAAPLTGNLDGGLSGAAVQYLPANHGLGYARYDTRNFLPGGPFDGEPRFPRLPQGFTFEQPIREHLAQLITFLDSAARGGPGRIEVTVPPRADHDGDGVLDDDERAHGTDPNDPLSH